MYCIDSHSDICTDATFHIFLSASVGQWKKNGKEFFYIFFVGAALRIFKTDMLENCNLTLSYYVLFCQKILIVQYETFLLCYVL